MICEEFPVRKPPVNDKSTYQSTNVDWLLYNASDDQLVFLELKTADSSFDPLQVGMYGCSINKIRKQGSSFLVEDLKEIRGVSLERGKYEQVLKCVGDQRYLNCKKAKLVYLAPAAIRDSRREDPETEVEWLSFQDLPDEVSGELAAEWRIIRSHLVQMDSITRHCRNAAQYGGERKNYGDTCRFEQMLKLCEANGSGIVVGFYGGAKKLRSATLDDLKKRPAFKWDSAEGGRGFKNNRNWIPGGKFLEIIEGLMDD
jgi:hypothetical protein